MKVNFDEAIFEDLKATSIGVAIRNKHGEVVAALAEQIPILDSIFTLETLAAKHVVHFVQELGLRKVVFKGDSESSIHAISKIDFYYIRLEVILFTTFYCLLAHFRAFLSLMCVGKVML